ncbi:FAD-dependent oxidoreductase [Streptomyces tubbatahanensis]|uniref:FAD-dependent oxidoreductase n=1 Tax=Streptomyces tubbatahanensis TaxID=2923272 RepID=A0ABY3XM54_9ACTN|nr:FAD-dependent oxidoreductase [Streptomyces tubbatahanensis]UNS95512.1 FAD-dependent oxidoreductase [Streptomyces tubbatahanensis]
MSGDALRLPGRALPVLFDVDVAVLGGTLTGVAAAVELAGAGRSVVVLEHGYMLGGELTAANRPWLTTPEDGHPPPPLLAGLLPPGTPPGRHLPLRPTAWKLHLEETLTAAGGQVLYGVDPLALHHGEAGEGRGVVIAGKSGRQLVRCTRLLDATGNHPVIHGAGRRAGGRGRGGVWSVEFDRVAEEAGEAARLAHHPAAAGARFVDGCRGQGHLYALLATTGDRWSALRAAGTLLREHPAFRHAVLGALGTRPLAARAASGRSLPDPVRPGVWCAPAPLLAMTADAPLLDPFAAVGNGVDLARAMAPAPRGPIAGPAPTADAVSTADASLTADASPTADAAPSVAAPPCALAEPVRLPCPSSGTLRTGEQDAPQRGRRYPRERVADVGVPFGATVDVLVVGGGPSGASAAWTAAEEGARVALVEAGPGPGGAGTYGGVPSYWFGRREGWAARLRTEVHRTHRALGLRGGVGRWTVEAKAFALHQALHRAGVHNVYDARACAVLCEGDRVVGAVFAGDLGPFAVRARVVVDATGDADLAAWAGAPCTYGAAGTHTVMWSSLGRIEAPGVSRNDFGGLADATDVVDVTRAVLAARRRGRRMHDHAPAPAGRESRHLRGQVVLTLTDQLTGRRWPDVVSVHFSNHDLKGKGEALWPQLGLIPPNLLVQVPYRALLPRGVTGLLVAGKALSATHDALPALRMQADMENLGHVAGLAAARCAAARVVPDELPVAALQAELVRRGRLPAEAPSASPPGTGTGIDPAGTTTGTATAQDTAELIRELASHAPLHTYADMGRREVFHGRIPFVLLALDTRTGTTDALAEALVREPVPGVRLLLGQLLALRGRPEGSRELLRHLAGRLAGSGLPPRTSRIREAQLPPDQSAMPDEVYLLHTLAFARAPGVLALWRRVAELVDADEETFRDPARSPFAWVDAVCAGAERWGDPAAVPVLEALHGRPALRDQQRGGRVVEPDDVQERRALLELGIGRALAACGSGDGYRVLLRYLTDNRALLAEQAHTRLAALTGVDLGKDPQAWAAHLAAHPPSPAPPGPGWDPHTADLPDRMAAATRRPEA